MHPTFSAETKQLKGRVLEQVCGTAIAEVSSDSGIRRDLAIGNSRGEVDSIMHVAAPPCLMPLASQTTGSSDVSPMSLKSNQETML